MSRLWGRFDTDPSQTEALGVRTEADSPVAIRWRGAWHTIEHIALSWQLNVCWWRERIYRDYYKVLAGGGWRW